MPSLDFIYDITEKLDEEEIEYLVLAIRKGRKEDKVDVTDEQLDYIFNTFTTLLNNKIDHCKMLFYEHRVNFIY